jgi:hypothetical protein
MGFGVDLMILDIPEDLLVPHSSIPTTAVPDWNILRPKFLDNVLDFTLAHLQDAGTILLFHADDLNLRAMLRGFNNTYDFMVFKEGMGINQLQMTSAKDKSNTVSTQLLALNRDVDSVPDWLPISSCSSLADTSILHQVTGQRHCWSFSSYLSHFSQSRSCWTLT